MRAIAAAAALGLALLAPALRAQDPPAGSALTTRQFAAECALWEERVRSLAEAPQTAEAMRTDVPPQWSVERAGQQISVSTAWLSEDLEKIARGREAAKAIADATQHLAALRRQAEAAEAPAARFDAERVKANEILSRREFAGVGPPTWPERMVQRIAQWLDDLLSRLIGRAFGHRTLGNALVWILIAAALVIIALFTYRRLTRQAQEQEKDALGQPLRTLDWSAWAQRASAAAARGDFRDAVHCAYWAAIYRLEAAGAWRPDPARTPREYLRLLPSDSTRRGPLLAITRTFELAWYGRHAATRLDFEQSAAELEKLGCALTSTQATARS